MTKLTISISSINLITTYKNFTDNTSAPIEHFKSLIEFSYRLSKEKSVPLRFESFTIIFYSTVFVTGTDGIATINPYIEKLLLRDTVFDILKKNKSHLEMLINDEVTLVYKFTSGKHLYQGTDKTSNYTAEFLVTEGI